MRRYRVLFGRRDPKLARRVAQHVSARAEDGFDLVETAVAEIAAELGLSRASAFRYLSAGRWLLEREGA